jgi:sulfur-oxidizing protein SoxY
MPRLIRYATAFAMLFALPFAALAADGDADDVWPSLKKDLFGAREVVEDAAALTLEAPYRAEDAAIVPITVRVPAAVAGSVKGLTLVVEKNPMPMVAKLTFGSAAGSGERVISTRVRIDMYSNVRAVIETGDGKLLMATKFVKAAGGCSAPALKDADEALAQLGKVKLKSLPAQSSAIREAQVMVRHPNYSGMQMNQLTGLYIPAKYVSEMEVRRGSDLVFRLEGGISLSEDPNIRFTYGGAAGEALEVTAKDTDGNVFTARSEPTGS